MKATLFIGIVVLTATPGFSHFVKAALGFRLGYSPTEGHTARGPVKKAVGVQLLTGLNNGGWSPAGFGALTSPTRQIHAAASNNVPQVAQARSATPVDAQVGSGVRHFRILGMNLYLGGRASQVGQPSVLKPVAAASAKSGPQASASQLPFLGQQPYQHQQHHPQHQTSPLLAFANPLQLGAGIGAGVKPIVAQAPNGGKIIGGLGGIRASVGVPGYGVGFNLGYRQGVNTKSPLGSLLSLGSGGLLSGLGFGRPHVAASVHHPAAVHHHRGHEHVYHLHGANPQANLVGGHNPFAGFPQALEAPGVTGLESKQHLTSQPVSAGGDKGPSSIQFQGQQSQLAQQLPQKHRGLQGPFAMASSNRPSFLSLFRPGAIFRSTPLKYTFNNPQSLPSGPIRMVLAPHPPTPAPQRPHPSIPSDVPPPGWSTLYSVTGPQNAFLNPLPANGQPLSKLQASLHSSGNPQASAQHQIPFVQPPHHQQPQGAYQGPFGGGGGPGAGYSGLFSSRPFHQPTSRPSSNPFRNFFSSFQRPSFSAPQQDYSHFYQQPQQHQQQQQHSHQYPQSPIRQIPGGHSGQFPAFQSFAPFNYHSSPLISHSRPPYLSQIQEQPLQASPTAPSKVEFPHLDPNVPFTADSMRFEPPAGYTYSHSTHAKPVSMGSYTMDMLVNGARGGGSSEQSTASSDTPMFGPLGRRIKKAKKQARQDTIIKKSDTSTDDSSSVRSIKPNQQQDMMEVSASNSITMASSIGSTSWTPMVVVNPPVLSKKSLETPIATQIVAGKPIQLPIKPSPAIEVPQEHTEERRMILKRRRLNGSGEVFTSPTVIPTAAGSSSSSPTSTTTTTTAVPSTSSSSPTTSSASVTTVVSP